MRSSALTALQQTVIERLDLVGLEHLADLATAAWADDRPFPCALSPAERATMEGAILCEDFKRANAEARAAAAQRLGA
ncbi:MAG TPA: hypothetical protein VH539_18170 [Gemmatimonadaceae bacterium]